MLSKRIAVFCLTAIVCSSSYAAESDQPETLSYLQKTSTYAPDGSPQFISHSEIFIHKKRKREVNEMGQISITDGETGRHVTIAPKSKRFILHVPKQHEDDDNGKKAAIDLRHDTARPSNEDAESIGSQTIDGQQTLGLRTIVERGAFKRTKTFWYEERTRRPRLVTFESDTKGQQKQVYELSRFRFTPLDASLFSMDPPKGYTVLSVDARETTFNAK